MEILLLILLYLISKNPEFIKNSKPVLENLKGSENILKFMDDLSKFTENLRPTDTQTEKCEKEPPSPTTGIADDFIKSCLKAYLNQ